MIIDKTFINRLKSGDEKAQKAFYQQFAPKMYGICLRFAKSNAEADDILQEGFIRIFNHIKDFRGEGSIEGWVRRTIVNTSINFYKKRIKQGISTELDTIKEKIESDNLIIDTLAAKELLEIIRELPDGYRTVFNLNVIEGYSHKEIGEMLDISENTSKSQLSRARATLQKRIKKILERDNRKL
jgi:RNA polymerase sigma-70 factor (ECF subfamily)